MNKKIKSLLKFLLLGLSISIFSYISLAANCWSYTGSSTCNSDNDCNWKSDPWGSWCEEKQCWSYSTNSSCPSTIPGTSKNCQWKPGNTYSWCETTNCYSYSGTNSNSCVNNTLNLSCEWRGECYNAGGSNTNCWSITNQSGCQATAGCNWGNCYEKGCWGYNTSNQCNGQTGSMGRPCTWQTNTWGSWCSEQSCSYYTNQSSCNSAPQQLKCNWDSTYNYCSEASCYNFGYTNASSCVNNSYNLSCKWDNSASGNKCMDQGCWSYTTSQACGTKPGCNWRISSSTGWCEEVQCWKWDSWNGGNRTQCESNSYGLSCSWSGNPSGNNTNGWCYKNITATQSCSNFTTERTCMDTYYCWWQYTNWSNTSAGGNCKTPAEFNTGTNDSILNEWNPGCYVFDTNQTDCEKIAGCTYANGECNGNSTIESNGLACSNVNDSSLCNGIALLSSCCSWQGNECREDRFNTACYKQMQEPPTGAKFCEDYNSYTSESLCQQISNSPWYMPCIWSNDTETCVVDTDDMFGGGTKSLMLIDNKNSCEKVNGKWITESYCEGNVSVPTGRCEYKFNEERNCDKACFACEYQKDGSAWNTVAEAKSGCLASKLGFCEFTESVNAPNKFGYCEAKDQFKNGVNGGKCNNECGACTFMGDPQASSESKQPKYFCQNSNASCKWVTDNSTKTGGYCVQLSEKLCEDDCGKCNTQSDCQNNGRTANNATKGACSWDSSKLVCTKTGQGGEVCWDALDNDGDGLIDCADSGCYTDPFCGITTGNCYGWTANATCAENGCQWINDTWGAWCENYGGQCWKKDGNRTLCLQDSNCQWTNGTMGFSGNCEQDWTAASTCMSYTTNATCANNGCQWSADTWCNSNGNGSSWCENYGGWCNTPAFAPKNCYQYDGNQTGCSSNNCTWKTTEWPYCSVDYSGNCWQYMNNDTCNGNSKCEWNANHWCGTKADRCNGKTQSNCEADSICRWRSEQWGGTTTNWCESKCYQPGLTSSTCNVSSGCKWTNGWCEEGYAGSLCNTYPNLTSCDSDNSCNWKSPGWCDPAGFIGQGASEGMGGGGAGIQCFKYDGTNQTACNAQTGCSWTESINTFCSIDFSKDCWKWQNSGDCNVSGCWWNPASGSGSCFAKADQCSMDPLLQNSGACNANGNCTWQGNMCSNKCNSGTVINENCNSTIGCKWMSGFCDPAGMTKMFGSMEKGAPAPLGFDETGEVASPSTDMCGFGMKDMGNAYGFGATVLDGMANASACNGEKLGGSKCPGGPGPSGNGNGNQTVEMIIYLDTDGSTSGNCALDNNASATGYEFKLRYKSYWNNSKNNEISNSYKCENGKWAGTDIKVTAWNQMMCGEIGGPMLAVDKSSLAKSPTLYDSTKDMRVYVATIGNSSYNSSRPTDTIGPAWTTPGSIDFEINDIFGFGTDTAKFENILKKGYVGYEDCYNSKDDNNDGNTDCNDYSCQYSSNCASSGVNAPGYVDTKTPQVVGIKIEEYTNAALIMYDTNKPANGTLLYYGKNDTTCTNESNAQKVNDIGITSINVRDYKMWHTGRVDNNTVPGSNISFNETHYYKIKICDINNKCAVSRCSSFKTADSLAKCGYCTFVTRLKIPNGWTVKYDTNTDGVYDHVQGEVCGPYAGMSTNFTSGQRVNILLASNDNTTEFRFINASLTKTALNDKVRTVNNATDFKNGTTTDSSGNSVGYVGMVSDTRDKIINNLHPEACEIKMPGTGTCTALWHCDDDLSNCKDLTSSANLTSTGANYCSWRVPYCEFSVWAGGQPGTYSPGGNTGGSSGGGGGSSGGGAGFSTRKRALKVNEQMGFAAAKASHSLKLIALTADEATVIIQSDPIEAIFRPGEEKKFDLDGSSTYDVIIKLLLINMTEGTATFTINETSEEIPILDEITPGAVTEIEEVSEEELAEESPEEFQEAQEEITPKSRIWLLMLLLVGIGSLIAIGILFKIKFGNDEGTKAKRR